MEDDVSKEKKLHMHVLTEDPSYLVSLKVAALKICATLTFGATGHTRLQTHSFFPPSSVHLGVSGQHQRKGFCFCLLVRTQQDADHATMQVDIRALLCRADSSLSSSKAA
jgi:hypothetical protein